MIGVVVIWPATDPDVVHVPADSSHDTPNYLSRRAELMYVTLLSVVVVGVSTESGAA